MNISFNWIDELAGLRGELRDPRVLAERVTMTAAAVEKIETVGAGLDGIVVSRVLETRPHPNADRLTLCKVDRGAGEALDVVCGAPVIATGGFYPHVAPGGELPGGFRIESRKIRGESSHGMLCSEAELELGRDKGGILRLADGLEPGTPLAAALGLPDTRLALDLNPNRVDLACHLGVAREVGGPPAPRDFGVPAWSAEWRDGESEVSGAGVTVRIEDLGRCSRYMAAVIRGVRVGPSPPWLAGRLLAVGARPISNVVDATNYVLHECNQPLHAFDLARLSGAEIRVRPAEAGEPLTTLDGQEHKLTRGQTVIADRDRAIALAGVMGGLDTEVTEDTVDLLIECASFDPAGVRRTRTGAGLSTDASYRFERGIDVHAQERALARCVELILATAGGEADVVGIRVGPAPTPVPPIDVRVSRVNQVLGFGLDGAAVRAALEPIGFETLSVPDGGDGASGAGDLLRVSVPGWRTDVAREIDLVEEVARRVGYDAAAGQDRRFRPSAVPADPRVEKAARVRELLTGRGLLEARSLSFMPEDYRGNRAVVSVPNPLSAEESCLRSAMVPVLLRRLEHNYARGNRNVRLFELGTVFGYAAGPGRKEDAAGIDRFEESGRVGAVVAGARRPDHWSGPGLDFDLWDLKEIAGSFADRLCGATLEPRDGAGAAAAEGRGASLAGPWLSRGGFRAVKDGRTVGVAGAVDGASVDAPPWAAPAFALEFDLAAVEGRPVPAYRKTSPFPAVRRDLSMTVPRGVPAADIERAAREATSDLLRDVRLFDVYSGEEIEGGRLGLAWTFRFRAPDRTLTDQDVEAEMSALSIALEKRFGARIRRS
ncbi:MAG: phenylalanine--tRNA ligase subunit beta [Gemmatimonadales bacterium]|nr:phenylalanine--tRNA ligase subunit beta [Gemmatimonadales bacterium]MYG48067.1 phenylalanine--tRNA ligase subunit beta [Gemmatimonadales bacterium]MYK01821.1 phenylalanine--tRNA ligase subunit beta [Candidatus Palauibacter ramosifaciens]